MTVDAKKLMTLLTIDRMGEIKGLCEFEEMELPRPRDLNWERIERKARAQERNERDFRDVQKRDVI